MDIKCLNCGRPYPLEGTPYNCPDCGGLYDLAGPLVYDPASVDPSQAGIWRYRHSFVLPKQSPVVSLGEGRVPLVPARAFDREVFFQCEFLNPTGSFKDRGTAPLVSFLLARGATEAIEDSSGNAGASFAAYAARGGLGARVFVPESASGPKKIQIEMYGAQVVTVPGPRAAASEAANAEARKGVAYASHAWLPFNLPGYATAAYELVECLGGAPGAVVVPAGQGGLLLGMARGFAALRTAGVIAAIPQLICVQARNIAPLWALATLGPAGLAWVQETAATVAEGVRVRIPLRAEAVGQAVQDSGGQFIAVDEEKILPGRDALARLGLFVEPTSALVWDALAQTIADLPEPVVAVLTGSGFKTAGP